MWNVTCKWEEIHRCRDVGNIPFADSGLVSSDRPHCIQLTEASDKNRKQSFMAVPNIDSLHGWFPRSEDASNH